MGGSHGKSATEGLDERQLDEEHGQGVGQGRLVELAAIGRNLVAAGEQKAEGRLDRRLSEVRGGPVIPRTNGLRADQVVGPVVDRVGAEQHHWTLDVLDPSPLMDLTGAHPQNVARAELEAGEVNRMKRRPTLDLDQ